MEGFARNSGCILAWSELFRALAGGEEERASCPALLEELEAREAESGCFLAPPALRERFGLDRRGSLLVMAALALEMDGGLRGAFRRTYGLDAPTVEYGLQLIEPVCPTAVEDLAELAGADPLLDLLLVPPGQEVYPLERPLVLCRTVLAFLTGPALCAVPGMEILDGGEGGDCGPLPGEELDRIGAWYAAGGEAPLTLCGPAGSGRRALLRRACGGAVQVDLREAGERSVRDREKLFREAAVAALLLGVPVCAAAWTRKEDLDGLVRSCRRSRIPLAVLSEEGETPLEEGEAVCLPQRPARGTAVVSLEDMVLPERVREQLELICQTARSGPVLSSWGLPGWREGVSAVFHGPSGTGKTMAASVIAGALGAPLLRADLSRIMDKYVGETEKHLAALLRRAKEGGYVLLFDEADALFSRRGEVSGGQDKYANLSTAYLLQEIEAYRGVVLLSTNLLSNFDEAFLRRLQFIVRFPMPDAAAREELWRRALPSARLEGEIPYAALAGAELSPARIGSAARCAAAAAVAGGRERVDAAGLLRALRLELEKSGKPLPRGLFGREG